MRSKLLCAQQLEASFAEAARGDVITLDLEQHAHGIAHAGLVLDQQDAEIAAADICLRRRLRAGCGDRGALR